MGKIMIHSNAPWVPSGYGKQTGHLARTLAGLGHEVVISSFCGLTGSPIEYQGMTVLPSGQYEYGVDTLLHHINGWQPDAVITLMDNWKLGPIADQLLAQTTCRVAAWAPVDCAPLSKLDDQVLKHGGIKPIAMSVHGQRQLTEAGFVDVPYAPHVVNRQVFKPLPADNRQRYREAMGLADRFVIGICAANNDSTRKGFPEQFEAFRRFHLKYPDALLLVHSIPKAARGLDLERLALDLGMDPSSVRFTDTYAQVSGTFDDSFMADWFGVLDVLSSCSYAEAFGVPMVEAQACGTPVVATLGSAMTTIKGPGWSVASDPFFNYVHGAWWARPRIDSIVRRYANAHEQAASRRAPARVFTEQFDCQTTGEAHWKAIVEDLCS